jgi:hypothetical protein
MPFALVLGAGSANADSWRNIQVEHVLNSGSPDNFVRLEGGMSNDSYDSYGFVDITERSNYAEFRINPEKIAVSGFKPGFEINTGEDIKNIARFGVIKAFSFNEHNTSYVKINAIELTDSGDEKKSQIGIYASQDIGNFNVEMVLDYNIDNGTVYAEPTLHYKLGESGTTFIRSRSFGEPKNLRSITTVGFRFDF